MGHHRLMRKVSGEDFLAKKAYYHQTCFNDFNLKYLNHLKKTQDHKQNFLKFKSVPTSAPYIAIRKMLVEYIIKASDKRKESCPIFKITSPCHKELKNKGYPNTSYSTCKIKNKLKNCHLGSILQFAVGSVEQRSFAFSNQAIRLSDAGSQWQIVLLSGTGREQRGNHKP